MSKIFEDNSLTIGHTPLVRLNRIGNGRILAKVESRNPSFIHTQDCDNVLQFLVLL